MTYKLLVLGIFAGATLYASPVQITISLSGGSFDRGVTTSGVDTGSGTFTTASAACAGAGCVNISNLTGLNGLTLLFSVPSGSSNGSGSTESGTLVQSSKLSGFTLTGQSSFSQNASFIENISATGILGQLDALTGTLALTWSGNSTVQAKSATGLITLNGDIASTPEPASALLFAVPFGLLVLRRCAEIAAANYHLAFIQFLQL